MGLAIVLAPEERIRVGAKWYTLRRSEFSNWKLVRGDGAEVVLPANGLVVLQHGVEVGLGLQKSSSVAKLRFEADRSIQILREQHLPPEEQ